ncbi:hypothetical protein EVAR_28066_1 [Eumeta japonica]|uniref:Uncharacterized protein n=1 Tax=Eumeta variegata TaxID=151549 RepID=A0A4C1W4N0_EUMVA|nr:hypothetical protein EVAR_28066_1 [Eumeta japonica]
MHFPEEIDCTDTLNPPRYPTPVCSIIGKTVGRRARTPSDKIHYDNECTGGGTVKLESHEIKETLHIRIGSRDRLHLREKRTANRRINFGFEFGARLNRH